MQAQQTKRYHAYNASFSRRTTVRQISEFLSQRLHVKMEDMRLWNFKVYTEWVGGSFARF